LARPVDGRFRRSVDGATQPVTGAGGGGGAEGWTHALAGGGGEEDWTQGLGPGGGAAGGAAAAGGDAAVDHDGSGTAPPASVPIGLSWFIGSDD